ncbi:MAG: alpha/beta fold hydrolase [Elusimicrobia bacterium]|nr:alpha/beta fold hydrolase [Elusimicrobiota bacterium]
MRVPAHSGAVTFKHKGLKLVAVLARPAGPERRKCPGVLFLHGFPGSEHNVDVRRRLMKLGVASLSLHFSGAWGSEGNYSFSALVPQAAAGLRYLASREFVDKRRLAVFGFSMGGWTALNLAAREPKLKGVVAVAPVGGPEMIDGSLLTTIAHHARPLRIRSAKSLSRDFVRAVKACDPARAVAKRAMPLLLVHGTEDDVVPCAISKRLSRLAREPKTLVVARGAQHDFLDRRDWLAKLCSAWLSRRLLSGGSR